uniref:UstYa family oxidase phomYc' n=1 Tax=Diaporthe leptostromiformis TaxID=291059 RepID=PHYC2_DIALO|nr:RecName: Full=UstYa family oxidase phomYc'; AltName: Full=Phomopsin biosynthesis cluster protein Yc'a [Diaporthe leptostromiformis]AMR44288.1 DUF3328 protein [Diaporthe leptostromiformis]
MDRSGYFPVLDEDIPTKSELRLPLESKTSSRSRRWLHLVLVLQSVLIISLLASLHILGNRQPSNITCAKQLSPYSPYLEDGDLELEEFTELNHLMQPSPYRGQPTPEIEEAWVRLWRDYAHVSTRYGDDMLGFLNVFHQLHCLNLVRQYTYRDDYDYSNVTAFRAPQELVRGHIDHCIETIRKSIMCASDVTPVVFQLDDSRKSGFKSDFNMRRTCRNFDKIQDWAVANAVQGDFEKNMASSCTLSTPREKEKT